MKTSMYLTLAMCICLACVPIVGQEGPAAPVLPSLTPPQVAGDQPGHLRNQNTPHLQLGLGDRIDPEAAKLYEEETAAAGEAQKIVASLRKPGTEENEKEALTLKLKEALTRQFTAQQKRRDIEIAKVAERLTKLKETTKKRAAAKETIIGRRLDELTGKDVELGWEETGTRLGLDQPVYTLPLSRYRESNVVPVPFLPSKGR